MNNLTRKIEVSANIAILVVAVLICFVLTKNYFLSSSGRAIQAKSKDLNLPVSGGSDSTLVGSKLPLSDVDWSKSGQTLILALQTDCHFCAESAPFYQRLETERQSIEDVRLVAVLPQSVDVSKRYLNGLNVTVDEIKQADPGSMQVRGTPTLLLIDKDGTVLKTWRGKLSADQENDVLASLR